MFLPGLALALRLLLPALLLALPLLQLLGLDHHFLQHQRLHLAVVHEAVAAGGAAEGRHARDDHQEHPPVPEVRGHLLNLDLLEAAEALVQALLDVPLQDLLARRVLLDELGRIFGAVEGETQRDLVGVLYDLARKVSQLDLKPRIESSVREVSLPV